MRARSLHLESSSRRGGKSMAREPKENHLPSPTSVAAEAQRTGVPPGTKASVRPAEIPGEEDLLKVGDPDDSALDNAYVGDETPGGSAPTPDQDRVDDIGRAYGVQEADSGALRPTSEILDERDRRRAQQDGPDRKP